MDNNILECCLVSGRLLGDSLSYIHNSSAKHAQYTTLCCSSAAKTLKFMKQEPGCSETTVLLHEDAFSSYACTSETPLQVRFSLNTLIDCINVLTSTDKASSISVVQETGMTRRGNPLHAGESMAMAEGTHSQMPFPPNSTAPGLPIILKIDKDQSYLELVMKELYSGGNNYVSTHCRVATHQDLSNIQRMSVLSSEILVSAVMKSEVLLQAFADLDYGGSTIVHIVADPSSLEIYSGAPENGAGRKVRIVCAEGSELAGSAANTSVHTAGGRMAPDAIHEWTCQERVEFPYRLQYLQRMVKALGASDDTRLRLNADGILAVTLKLRPSVMDDASKVRCFIEFLSVAEETEL